MSNDKKKKKTPLFSFFKKKKKTDDFSEAQLLKVKLDNLKTAEMRVPRPKTKEEEALRDMDWVKNEEMVDITRGKIHMDTDGLNVLEKKSRSQRYRRRVDPNNPDIYWVSVTPEWEKDERLYFKSKLLDKHIYPADFEWGTIRTLEHHVGIKKEEVGESIAVELDEEGRAIPKTREELDRTKNIKQIKKKKFHEWLLFNLDKYEVEQVKTFNIFQFVWFKIRSRWNKYILKSFKN